MKLMVPVGVPAPGGARRHRGGEGRRLTEHRWVGRGGQAGGGAVLANRRPDSVGRAGREIAITAVDGGDQVAPDCQG